MQGDSFLGGLWCSEVLARLDGAVDGTLLDDEKAQVEAHVHACFQCARFGARYAALIGALKREQEPVIVDTDRADRVLARVWQEDASSTSGE